MIKTHGLSHVALSVLDPDRSLAFYQSVFGVREYFRSDSTVQVLGPGQYDVLAFEKRPADAGVPGGIIHFGNRSGCLTKFQRSPAAPSLSPEGSR
jgi:catechol 2,3-dioxygenase-like lactoylglutathione lyase family enzyme